ncbi:hypothetical protein V8E53_003955 [Lactarius tabidus]
MPVALLPFELLAAIFEDVNNVQDLWNARLASRTLCAAASPIAFRLLSVIATRTSAQNLGRLFDVPYIAAHVRRVSFHDTGTDRRGRTLIYVRTSAINELASSFSRIHQLPRLETINLNFYGKWHTSDRKGRLALQESILGALAESFSVCAPSKLTTLSLHSLNPSVLSSLDSPAFQTVLTTLRQLELSMTLDRSLGLNAAWDPWVHFWGLCPPIVLSPTQHSLTELTLHSDVHVGSSSGLSLRALHFPHLRALSLCNLVFDRSVGAEDFILRHAATLVQLGLIMCKLPFHIDRSLSLSPSPSLTQFATLARDEESNDGPRCWDRIWDRFATELTGLVSLYVDERRRDLWGNASLECRYVDPGTRISYREIDAPEPRNTADAKALQRFGMTVAARSEVKEKSGS